MVERVNAHVSHKQSSYPHYWSLFIWISLSKYLVKAQIVNIVVISYLVLSVVRLDVLSISRRDANTEIHVIRWGRYFMNLHLFPVIWKSRAAHLDGNRGRASESAGYLDPSGPAPFWCWSVCVSPPPLPRWTDLQTADATRLPLDRDGDKRRLNRQT